MVSVTPASRYITSSSRYHPGYQSRSSMYIRGLIPWNFAELGKEVSIIQYCQVVGFISDVADACPVGGISTSCSKYTTQHA